MSVHNNTSNESLKKSINKTLYDRKAGIKYIKFKNYKLENLHDINQFMLDSKKDKNIKFEVEGNILDLEDIKDLSQMNWPKETTDHINKGGHYVFFRSEFDEASFLTTHNFQTQFGRQVVFENELNLSNSFDEKIDVIKKNNQFLEVWKWQNCMFEANIIKTVNLGRLYLKDLHIKYEKEIEKFKIKTIT